MLSLPPSLVARLDLASACDQELKRTANRLVPRPLEEDAIRGHKDQFVGFLYGKLERGLDLRVPEIVQAPRGRAGLRPASILGFEERVTYAALVGALSPSLDTSAVAYEEMQNGPIEAGAKRVLLSDLFGFYQFVDHGLVVDQIVSRAGDAELARAIEDFLRSVTGRVFGLPQGYEPSDKLADLALDVAHRRMVRHGVRLFRHNDDFRICGSTKKEVQQALWRLDREVRAIGLALNFDKTYIMRDKQYKEYVAAPAKRWDTLSEESDRDLSDWSPYAQEPEPGDSSTVEDAALTVLTKWSSLKANPDALDVIVWEKLLRRCLAISRFYANEEAGKFCRLIVRRYPRLTPYVGLYLEKNPSGQEVLDEIALDRNILSEWQAWWLLYSARGWPKVGGRTLEWARLLNEEAESDSVRAESLLRLARESEVSSAVLGPAFENARAAARPTIAGAVAAVCEKGEQLSRTVARESPICSWVIDDA